MFEIQKKLRQPPSPQHITSKLMNIPTEVIHHNVSHFPGPLLLVILAVHSLLVGKQTGLQILNGSGSFVNGAIKGKNFKLHAGVDKFFYAYSHAKLKDLGGVGSVSGV